VQESLLAVSIPEPGPGLRLEHLLTELQARISSPKMSVLEAEQQELEVELVNLAQEFNWLAVENAKLEAENASILHLLTSGKQDHRSPTHDQSFQPQQESVDLCYSRSVQRSNPVFRTLPAK
jgi:hypothetical protein